MDDIRLVAGLGNPGEEYRGTRHNVGFDAIDLLADGLKVEMDREKFGASFGQINIGSKKLILLKPMLFMNNSGQAVAAVCNFYKIAPGDILALTDDLALEPGMIRIRSGGSAGGHNGLADIVAKLGTDQFGRLRIGIGGKGDWAGRDYVLSRPDKAERELIDKAVMEATKAAMVWLTEGIAVAMNKFNKRMSPGETGEGKENLKDKN
ncbi:MAG: aminoacyl-tRNA hydrolase [Phycisphaerae bacterium]|jgi:PTH1 family peptidyl-tRNA hydrolase